VEWISNTRPLPADKPAIAAAHVLAAEMMGMRWAYLEAGSGAQNPVPLELIAASRALTTATLIVGGGIRTPEQAAERVVAGAQAIVIGNHFEKHADPSLVQAFAHAIHGS
jgi:phosphoglycerol geranylgeranyltransferase